MRDMPMMHMLMQGQMDCPMMQRMAAPDSRLRQLEDENGKLKRLLAESVLDNAILKDLLGKV